MIKKLKILFCIIRGRHFMRVIKTRFNGATNERETVIQCPNCEVSISLLTDKYRKRSRFIL